MHQHDGDTFTEFADIRETARSASLNGFAAYHYCYSNDERRQEPSYKPAYDHLTSPRYRGLTMFRLHGIGTVRTFCRWKLLPLFDRCYCRHIARKYLGEASQSYRE